MDGGDSLGRHDGDRFGGWMAEIGRADTGKAGFVDGVMREKNKKSSAAGKPHCKIESLFHYSVSIVMTVSETLSVSVFVPPASCPIIPSIAVYEGPVKLI